MESFKEAWTPIGTQYFTLEQAVTASILLSYFSSPIPPDIPSIWGCTPWHPFLLTALMLMTISVTPIGKHYKPSHSGLIFIKFWTLPFAVNFVLTKSLKSNNRYVSISAIIPKTETPNILKILKN